MSTKRRADENDGEGLDQLELTDEQMNFLTEITKEEERMELILDIEATKRMAPLYEKRRSVLASIPKFWLAAMSQHAELTGFLQLKEDREALGYLKEVYVLRDNKELRAFTLEFHFNPNPYFTDSVLKKEFKYTSPKGAAAETPDANGLTPSMLDFDWERDIVPSAIKINWKPNQNLTANFPSKMTETNDDDDDAMDLGPDESYGSFFNFFEIADDDVEIGLTIADDLYPAVVDYFFGRGSNSLNAWEDDDTDEDSEDDDDDAEEIDLEKPRVRKNRTTKF